MSVLPHVNNFCTLLVNFTKSQKKTNSKDSDKDQEGDAYPDPR